jgi:hypothetical protein
VNGQPQTLDVPAMIVHGSTMVPLRFVGEALGNTVEWNDQDQTVEITTDAGGADRLAQRRQVLDDRAQRIRQAGTDARSIVLTEGTVVPVALDDPLSSDQSATGVRFAATLSRNDSRLPEGTKIEGYVEEARPRLNNHPGMLELRFDKLDLPNGETVAIHGSLIGLDNNSIVHRGDRLFARHTDVDRGAYVGYGAGGGLIVGFIGGHPLKESAVGALLGLSAGSLRTEAVHNVHLDQGTQFGVRLNGVVSIKGR